MDISGYEIAELLGQGGFGVVYRARQLAVGREVALKVDGRLLAGDRDRRRFMREVTAAGRLSGHPNVVAVYDAGLLGDGRPYLVMELCPDGSLADLLRAGGPLPPAEVRDIGVRIADAVAAVHAEGILHRDIKPGNILIDRYGNPALADFGLAAMPSPGMESSVTREALTPAYAPPEAFRMVEPAPPGDVYALAATLYALLAGRPPHFPATGSPSIPELIAAHTRPVPDVPGAPAALSALLRQALAPDPAARPTAAALRDALHALPLPAAERTAPPRPLARTPVPHTAPPTPASAGLPPSMPGLPPQVPGFPSTTVPPGQRANAGFATAPGQPAPKGVSKGVVLGAAGLLAAGVVAAALVVTLGNRDDGTPPAAGSAGPSATATATDVFAGVATTTQNCPAAAVAGARARCTAAAECWSGIVQINGDVGSTNRNDCADSHVYETFAVAPLPADGQTWNAQEVAKNPVVKALCSTRVMLASRFGAATSYPASAWDIEILPPGHVDFAQGARLMRCVATLKGHPLTGTAFRPLHATAG